MGRNGSGVREASSTSYEITFTYKGTRCRERVKLQPSTTNRRRVENHLGAILDSFDKGTFDYTKTFPDSPRRLHFLEYQGDALLLSTYLDNWLEAQNKRLKASTILSYTKIINLIIKQFPATTLDKLTRSNVKSWLSSLKSSNKNIANLQSVIRTALQEAVSDGLIETNPLYGWFYANKDIPKTEDDVDPFDMVEQNAILNELNGQAKNMVQFFFWTGLRPSELIALQWDDIDWRRKVIGITKSLTQAAEEFEDTKNKSSRREVKILEPAMQALIAQKQYTYLANKEIFQNPKTNEIWIGDRPIRQGVWKPALKRANVRYRRPYQTRHTYASMMLTAGESIPWLAKQLGHSSIITTMSIYAKFIKDAIPDAGNKAVEMFTKKAGNLLAIKP